jgi:hypothetical protein
MPLMWLHLYALQMDQQQPHQCASQTWIVLEEPGAMWMPSGENVIEEMPASTDHVPRAILPPCAILVPITLMSPCVCLQ